jgi:predicted MFS family arabinose efflux permease
LVGRALSGVGAAGILTISIILVLELTTKRTRGLFIGLVNAGYTSGVALGAVIAGALVDVTGWRVLFGVQTPLALIAGSAVFFIIPEEFESGPRSAPGTEKDTMRQKLGKIDYLGAVTLTSTIVLFLYGMASAQIQWIPIAVAPVLLAGFVVNEVYWAKVPVIPVSVLASRGALFSCVAQLGLMAARWMVLFYSPVYAMAVRGWDGAAAGSMLIPTNVGFALGSLIVGWFHVKRSGSFWLPCVVIFVCFSVTLFILGQLSTATSPAWVYFVATFANGFCTGAALNYTLAHMLHISLPSVHFIVTGLLATFRGFAGSFGSAIGAGIFGRVLESSLVEGFREKGLSGKEELIRKLLGGPALVAGLQGVEHEVAVNAYTVALQRLFTAASGLALFVVLLQAGTGWHKPVEKDDRDSGVRTGASDSD